MKIAAFAALLALSFAGVAHAREPTDAAKVASYCTAQGAFGQSFGATAISGRLKMQSMNSEFVTPGALYPPFDDVEIVRLTQSRKIHTITGTAEYDDVVQAKANLKAIADAVRAGGKFPNEKPVDAGETAFWSAADENSGVHLDLMTMGRGLYFTCVDAALAGKAMDEFLAPPPRQDKKPVFAAQTPPPRPSANACSDPGQRAAIAKSFEDNFAAVTNYGNASNQRREKLANWYSQILKDKKAWTDGDEANFMMGMLNDPKFAALFSGALTEITGLVTQLAKLGDARDRKDDAALQRSLRRAYEDQLVLKVMPKLRGIETSGDSKRNCLDPIRKLLENNDLGLGLSEDFDIACRVGYGAFIWNSARYLERIE